MIAAWMLYCVVIGLAFVVLGHALERALHLAGRQTRWAWSLALAGTLLLPAAAWLRPDGFRTVAIPVSEPVVTPPADEGTEAVAATTVEAGAPAARAFGPSDLDRPLAWGWGAASAALLLVLITAAVRLAALERRWRAIVLDGRSVLVSDDVGPAVTGLWDARVVIPSWALDLSQQERRLILLHEEEHLRAGDPWLLALARAALVLAPWNPALWWQVRNLRLAVELDCDARVLARGARAAEYGDLLLRVGRRRARRRILAAALGDPASFLTRRVQRMVATLPRWRWAGAGAALVVAAGAVVAACEAPRPVGPDTPIIEEVFLDRVVDERPELLSGRLEYPSLLQTAGIQGRVVVRAIVDATGRVEPASLQVIESAHPGFDESARDFLLGARFRPGRVRGRAVRVLVEVPIHFRLSGNSGRPAPAGRFREAPRPVAIDERQEHREAVVMPWIRDGLTRHHADLLGNGSPEPLDVWFVSDHQKRVLRTWRNPRASDDITSPGFLRAMRDLPRGDVAKISSTTPRSLTGENVRVIWVEFRRPADEAMTTSGTAAPGGGAVLTEATVDERPELLSAPAPEYPSLLRSAGIQGRVVVRAIIDATGRAEPASVQVIESAHPGFDQSARQSVLGARFRPGRMQGQAVRVLIEFPITFRIGG